MTRNDRPAIVLSSGGLDSTTCLAIAKADGFGPIYSLSFDYGQRHRQELSAAAAVAREMGAAEHRVIQIDLRQFGKSALTDAINVPKDRGQTDMVAEIPITYVPARNTIFLSYALAWAEVLAPIHRGIRKDGESGDANDHSHGGKAVFDSCAPD
jgi:7-cyano-7-deazaguanine synthase